MSVRVVVAIMALSGFLSGGCADEGAPATAVPMVAGQATSDVTAPTASPSPSIAVVAETPVTVLVGGRRLLATCSGTPVDGIPTVLFEAGLGDDLRIWARVRDQLRDVRTCAYSRAGLGGSDRRESEAVALDEWVQDLKAVIATVSPEAPVVLVGHSIGGPIVRRAAAMHADVVAGLVLLDPTPDRWLTTVTRELDEGGTAVDPVAVGELGLASPGLGHLPLLIYTTSSTVGLRFEGQLETATLSSRGLVVVSDSDDHVLQRVRPTSVARLVRVVVDAVAGAAWPSCEQAIAGSDDTCPSEGS